MTPSNDRPQPADAPAPEELRQQVEQTWQELGETVEAPVAKADIKAQAKQTAAAVTEQADHVAAHAAQQPSRESLVFGEKTASRYRGASEPASSVTGGGPATCEISSGRERKGSLGRPVACQCSPL
ncbi:DUF3618 domain-containing protein [Streptomyces sp. NPDC052000]|uniref:DUF3618 domain-containing protein n=1 Tax=Streptomyces sp. NPDC052000 TaxID=3155676 RepID=UPI00344EDF94